MMRQKGGDNDEETCLERHRVPWSITVISRMLFCRDPVRGRRQPWLRCAAGSVRSGPEGGAPLQYSHASVVEERENETE